MNQDEQHLNLLSIFHYVVGGLTALFSLFGLIHLGLGLLMILAPEKLDSKGAPPPALVGWVFAIIGGMIITVGWILAGAMVAAGRFLARRRHYVFCLVVAGIESMLIPLGTALGVFTIVVLMRPSARAMFMGGPPVPPIPGACGAP